MMPENSESELFLKIKELEQRIEDALETGKERFSYELKQGKAVFSKEIKKLQRKEAGSSFFYIINAPIGFILGAPIIYGLIIPALLLDLFVTVYHWICFPIYKIEKVKRKEYIFFDRHRLHYLNTIEKFNCLYCSYFNGLISYVSEIAGRTEQYFCPIKHSKKLKNRHNYYHNFLSFGDYEQYHKELTNLRKSLHLVHSQRAKTLKEPKK